MIFEATIPVFRHIVKKNSRPIWRGRIGKSKELVAAEEYLTAYLKNFLDKHHPITDKVGCCLTFIFGPDQKRSYSLTDISNLYELPQDCLQKSGILKNDRLIAHHDGSRKKLGARTLLKIKLSLYNEELGEI